MFAIILVIGFALAYVSSAQHMQSEEKEELKPERKHPSFFHRPAEENPADQLGFAKSLLLEGQNRAAMKQYLALVHKWHDSKEASEAQFMYAKLLEDSRKYIKAFDEFQYLIDNFTSGYSYEEALEHQFRIAYHIMTVRRFKFLFLPGFVAPERAVPLFEKITRNGPNWKKTPQAHYYLGFIYEQIKEYQKAVSAYELLNNRYPDNDFSEESQFKRAYCLYTIANKNPRDEVSCRNALSAITAFFVNYPDDENADTAKQYLEELKVRLTRMYFERAEFYDKIAKRPESALIMYRDFVKKFPYSELSEEADKRIEELKGKETNE
ncbi:outer membrane protein assembly factor BamD [Verrucomicrobiota bacterium]